MKKLKQQQQMVSGGGMKFFKSNNQEELIMKNLNKTMVKTNQEGFKMIQSIFTIFILTLMINLSSCMIGDNDFNVTTNGENSSSSTKNDGKGQTNLINGIDYNSYKDENKSITVTNNTLKNLVAFYGSPRKNNLIGGIPASASNHNLKRTAIFSHSQDFVLFLITEEEYLSNIDDLSVLDKTPFTRLYCFYNENTSNSVVYPISVKLGGDCKITLQNLTPYNIELRRDGIYGEAIGYAQNKMLNTTFSVQEGNYLLFPVFRMFDKSCGEILTAIPRYVGGDDDGEIVFKSFSLNAEEPAVILDARAWVKGVRFAASASYLLITNSTSNGISLYDGSTSVPIATSTGGIYLNSGRSFLYEIKMQKIGPQKYEDFHSSAQYRIGNEAGSYIYLTSGNERVGEVFDYVAGRIYRINVEGSDTKYRINTCWKDSTEDMVFDDNICL